MFIKLYCIRISQIGLTVNLMSDYAYLGMSHGISAASSKFKGVLQHLLTPKLTPFLSLAQHDIIQLRCQLFHKLVLSAADFARFAPADHAQSSS